jgi:hypothetical protein
MISGLSTVVDPPKILAITPSSVDPSRHSS